MRNISKVKVTLGLKADGPLPQPVKNTLGEVTVGPLGLLNLMETQLGIPTTDTPFTTRLIQYLACIDSSNHPGAFYHASYDADPFSVARTLLQWRDQWYLAGWTGDCDADSPARLLEMATIEAVAKHQVDDGLGQRVQHVISLLADRKTDVVEVFVNAGSYLAFINLVNIGRTCKRDNVIVVLN